ncbi:phage terminase small subunit [Paraliobacillus ryukyuensis]|uniref:phage terminase small subunit n=1 Tax=Paraliobacillus ryukyuensis TaxID=200904 RepID=UPI0009A7C386|nr:phage terminase small subunit [Paraliobacillus ryukyuensis]
MNWDEIRKEYETTTITLKALAEKHNAKLGTLKSRKSREGWSRDATKSKKVATVKKDAPKKKKQKNRSGNPNPKNQFTKRNSAAVTHGLFSKYLPEETTEIMNDIETMQPLDILWMNIKMQFASIIRAQQIMFVESKEDTSSEVIEESLEKTKYEVQFAWDKQATFMNSLSRSMAELRNMLKQFAEMADYDDYRLLEIQKMQVTIDKTEKEKEFIEERIKNVKGDEKDTSLMQALIEGRKQYDENS